MCIMFSFQQLNITFIQETEYIAVDIPHFILVLFILFVCSKQIPAIYEIVQVVMILGRTYLTRIVWHVFVERNLTPVSVYNTQGEL